ncbi:chordopoxvirus G3 family protein, partial [Streptococcus pneumoniae]|nr:chordopoxvirus G3 family protein [Streptococcus pneumoniae]
MPVTAARTPSNTDPIDDSVPVLGNSFWDLPVDPEAFPTCEFEWFAEFETDVLAEADALVDAEALVDADSEALVL